MRNGIINRQVGRIEGAAPASKQNHHENVGRQSGPPGLVCLEELSSERWLTLGLFALSFLYLCLFRRYTIVDPDEGIALQGAQRILQGEVLYRDFFSYSTPGSYYLLALLFRIFGSSMLVARTALAVYGALFSTFTYLLARRVCARWVALLAAYLVTLTCLPWRFMALHNWDSTLWACAALYCALRLVAPGIGPADVGLRPSAAPAHWGWALGTGSFASLTVLFEQSKGAGMVLGLGLGFFLLHWLDRGEGRLSRAHWLALGMGFAWPCFLTLGYFTAHHALPALVTDWLWPFRHYSKVNRLPYGYQPWSNEARDNLYQGPWLARALALFMVSPTFLIPALPIIAAVLLVYWVLEAKKGQTGPGRAAYYVMSCSVMVGLALSVIGGRADTIHFAHLSPILYLVLAWLIGSPDLRGTIIRSMRPLLLVGIFLSFTALGMVFLFRNFKAHSIIETRRGVLRGERPDMVLEYTQAHVPAGASILVYPYSPLYYYLTATSNPTPYEYIQPGMHTPEQQREVIRIISRERTPVVLLQPGFNETMGVPWPNTPLEALANDPVTDYILGEYRPCKLLIAEFLKYRFLFMVRRDLACP